MAPTVGSTVATLATPMANTTTMPALEPLAFLQKPRKAPAASEGAKDEKEKEKEKEKEVAPPARRAPVLSAVPWPSVISSSLGLDGLPRVPGSGDFVRTFLRGHLSNLNTAEGWLARWPKLTASHDSLEAFCHMLMNFFDDMERARKVFPKDGEAARFHALFDNLRTVLTTRQLAIADEETARKLASDTQRETKALLDVIYVWNKTTCKISLGEPPRFDRQEALERLAAQSQKQYEMWARWYDAVEALVKIERVDTSTLHERVVVALTGARKMLRSVVEPDLCSFLFSDEGPV